MRDRHGSPFEHNSMTFYVQAPIFVFREFMRHRIASYNEESGRYRELRPVFYVPGPSASCVQDGKPGAYEFVDGTAEQHDAGRAPRPGRRARQAYAAYQRMLDAGVAREVARVVLPVAIYSSMYVTMNARSLMNFLSLRTKREDSHFPSFPQREIEMVRGADGGGVGAADAAHPRRLRGQRPRRPLTASAGSEPVDESVRPRAGSVTSRRRHRVASGVRPVRAVLTAMVTPFTADGALDLDGAQRLAVHLVDARQRRPGRQRHHR